MKQTAAETDEDSKHVLVSTIITKGNFSDIQPIGKGGFGRVYKVTHTVNGKEYALKEMSKARIVYKQNLDQVRYEKELLIKLQHPFLMNMHSSFQDEDNLYFVMDLMTGGDLKYHLMKKQSFTEEQTKFIAASIILGLEAMNKQGIMHKDIKPGNILFDQRGYLKISDFGLAQSTKPGTKQNYSGTPGFRAPEVILHRTHDASVDFYALGLIAYQCALGQKQYESMLKQKLP